MTDSGELDSIYFDIKLTNKNGLVSDKINIDDGISIVLRIEYTFDI